MRKKHPKKKQVTGKWTPVPWKIWGTNVIWNRWRHTIPQLAVAFEHPFCTAIVKLYWTYLNSPVHIESRKSSIIPREDIYIYRYTKLCTYMISIRSIHLQLHPDVMSSPGCLGQRSDLWWVGEGWSGGANLWSAYGHIDTLKQGRFRWYCWWLRNPANQLRLVENPHFRGGGNSHTFLCSPFFNLGVESNPFWRAYFSKGLVQPPTSNEICLIYGWNVDEWMIHEWFMDEIWIIYGR